jgi:uncharacterized membrane protein YagU involved in acid resistance
MNRLVRGAVAGSIATGTMSCLMFGGKAAGLLVTPPPKEITHRAGEGAGVEPHKVSKPAFTASWLAAHLGFGVGCGMLFTFLKPLFPGRVIAPGLVYGGLVWGVSYLGVLPALGLYPLPSRDSGSRTAVMIAAHAVFGITLAEIEERYRPA